MTIKDQMAHVSLLTPPGKFSGTIKVDKLKSTMLNATANFGRNSIDTVDGIDGNHDNHVVPVPSSQPPRTVQQKKLKLKSL